MSDLWAFLLQTLTASGVAALLLLIKALFQDKLTPRWQFLVWSVLGIVLLVPAGYHGRYVFFRWQIPIEMLKALCGDFGFTHVYAPIPLIKSIPTNAAEWIFALYAAGAVFFAIRYLASYCRLRGILRKGTVLQGERLVRIEQIAEKYNLKLCPVVEAEGLPSAFVCGVFRPILAVPMGKEQDEKVILHELYHLKQKDTFWSIVICLLRCIHWCNPLLVSCANRALNDMEARCDQAVLESLEGEERRDYGRILLSMANEKFAKTPGSTCINNGGKNIRRRIEAIARFRRYPQGMRLVSACIIVVLAFSAVVGAQPEKVYAESRFPRAALAAAKSTPCMTYAGALDAYAKSVLEDSSTYRYMCAPAAMQKKIWQAVSEDGEYSWQPEDGFGLYAWFDRSAGYYIYNLVPCGQDAYEGLLVLKFDGMRKNGLGPKNGKMFAAVQNLRVEKENERWVVQTLDEITLAEVSEGSLVWGCMELPGISYTAESQDIRVEIKHQTVSTVENYAAQTEFGYNDEPQPNAPFSRVFAGRDISYTYLGAEENGKKLKSIGLSAMPLYGSETAEKITLQKLNGNASEGGSSTNGEIWETQILQNGLVGTLNVGGGGGDIDPGSEPEMPRCYAADFYVNGEFAEHLTMNPQKEAEE